MDAGVFEALKTAVSPEAPEQLRAQALEYLEQFKRSDSCGEWSFAILRQPTAPPEARHFALQCLACLLKSKWKGWSRDIQTQFRAETLGLMDGTAGTEVFMRERVALLVSGVGEREYPQNWPTMLADLLVILETRGPVPAIIVFMVLRDIAEDCVDSDYNNRLATGRRNDILRQLNVELPELLPRLYAFMAKAYESRATSPAAIDTLRAALHMLKRFVNWISHDLLFGAELNFVHVFRCLMVEESLRLEAVECLRDLGSRKFENMTYMKVYMDTLEAGTSGLLSDGSAWSSLVFAETMCHTLSGFISQNLDKLLDDKSFTTPGSNEHQMLVRYLQLMTQLLKLPSLRAAGALLTGWTAVLKAQGLKGCPDTAEALLLVVLEAYSDKTVKLHFDEGSASFADSPVADEEFIDAEEYHAFLSTLKANVVTLMRTAGEHYPHRSLDFLHERLPALVARYGAATDVTASSDSYRYFEGLVSPVDRILSALPEPKEDKKEDVEMVSKISWLLQVLLDWNVSDPLLLYCHCLLLEGFRRFYRFLKPQLLAVLERLFKYMEYRDPALVGQTFARPSLLMKGLSQEALQVRRRGSNSLTEICNSVPDIVVSLLPQMVEMVNGLMVKGEVSDAQRPQLIEMLVVVSNAIEDPAERTMFITNMAKDALKYWESPETTTNLSSVSGLLKLLGVNPDGSVPAAEDVWDLVFDQIHGLLGALNTFLGIARRMKVPTQEDVSSKDPVLASIGKALVMDRLSLEDLARINPFVPIWTRILPNLMALMRSLHGLWGPDTRPTILAHAEARHILSIHDDELQTRLKGSVARATALVDLSPVRRWPLWLNQIRQSLYQLLEKACHQKVMYYSTDALVAMQETVTTALPFMEHRHVPWFAKMFIETYVINCPTPLFASHLPPILSPFMNHMMMRCSVTWNPDRAAVNGMEYLVEGGVLLIGENITADGYETLIDKLKREVTRGYVECLQTCLALRGSMIQALVESNKAVHHQQTLMPKKSSLGNVHSHTNGNADPRPPPPAGAVKTFVEMLCRFLVVDSEAIAVPLLLSIIGALCWQDQHSCRRAVSVAHRALEVGGKEAKLYPAFGKDVFGQVVYALLSEPPWIMGMQNDLLTLACDIYRMLVIGDEVRTDVATGQRTAQVLCDLPRQFLLTIPGLTPPVVAEMEAKMLAVNNAKEQREVFKEAMQVASEAMGDQQRMNGHTPSAKDESILRGKQRFIEITNLPRRLIDRGHSLSKRSSGVAEVDLTSLFGSG